MQTTTSSSEIALRQHFRQLKFASTITSKTHPFVSQQHYTHQYQCNLKQYQSSVFNTKSMSKQKQQQTIINTNVRLNNCVVHVVQYNNSNDKIGSLLKSSVNETTILNNNLKLLDKDTSSKAIKHLLIIFVPGNPGLLGLYHDFLSALLTNLKDQSNVTILGLSHNNFINVNSTIKNTTTTNIHDSDLNFIEKSIVKSYTNEPHHIELQVLNKILILKKLLNVNLKDVSLMFIGHSIGCHVILRLMQEKVISESLISSILVHPALDNIAKTQKGQSISYLFTYKLDTLIKVLAYILDALVPVSIKTIATKYYCPKEMVERCSDIVLNSFQSLGSPKNLVALMQMAKSEFEYIKNSDVNYMIKDHVDKIKIIYSINDGWVDEDCKISLKDNYPSIATEELPTIHAFIMEPSTTTEYASKISIYLREAISKKFLIT